MHTRHASRWFWPVLAVVCLTILFFCNRAATQSQTPAQKPDVKTANGLTVVTFTVNPGKIKVNLPDDMRAGDTISGTATTEPKGNTEDERKTNAAKLSEIKLTLGSKFSLIVLDTSQSCDVDFSSCRIGPFTTKLPESFNYTIGVDAPLTGTGTVTITINSKIWFINNPPSTPATEPPASPFGLPSMGQQGRPVEITGPFDGNSSNTTLNGTAAKSTVQDFEKGTENVSSGFGLLAESPRKAVFQPPTNVKGPIELKLKEGNVETKGTYRNVGVNLSAPKTNLLKGEKTTLTVQVSGLEGIKQPVPLTLECKGVITMEGGIYQPLVIQPSEVSADGRYTTTRGITGVQTGGWEATATVVTTRFNVCLQDDTAPHRRILWNTVTGEYIFTWPGWPPKGKQGGAGGTTGESGGGKTGGKTESGGTIQPADPNLPPTVPPTGLTGTGRPIRKGCILTLTHNAPDRRVMSRLDSCTTSGTSTIEDPKTKVKFTITDRNIADNTCGMQ